MFQYVVAAAAAAAKLCSQARRELLWPRCWLLGRLGHVIHDDNYRGRQAARVLALAPGNRLPTPQQQHKQRDRHHNRRNATCNAHRQPKVILWIRAETRPVYIAVTCPKCQFSCHHRRRDVLLSNSADHPTQLHSSSARTSGQVVSWDGIT